MRAHNKIRKKSTNEKGFTLLEVVLALMIMTLLLGAGYRTLSAIGRGQVELKEQRDLQAAALSIMTRLIRELQLATQSAKILDPEQPGFLRAVDRRNAEYDSDEIIFMANGAGQQLADGFFNSGLVQIKYLLAPDSEDRNNPWLTLIREEIPNKKPFEKAQRERVVFPVHNRIAGLDFKFYMKDDRSWRSLWEDENSLPDVVQVTLHLASNSNQVHTYTTAVKIK